MVFIGQLPDLNQQFGNVTESVFSYLTFTETGEFPAQMASNAENVSIWWRHYA